MVHLDINIRTPTARRQESDFVVPISVDMVASGEFEPLSSLKVRTDEDEALIVESPSDSDIEHAGDTPSLDDLSEARVTPEPEGDEEFIVGRLWAERLDWSFAEECAYSVYSICDARSGTWMQVLETLTRNDGRHFRKELNIEHFISDIVFIHEVLIHPEIRDRVALLAAAIREISTESTLVLMHHEQSEAHHLEDWEGHELGFKKIARSNLLLRDNHFRYPFGESYPAGRPVSFTATAEHEIWLLDRWYDLVADHPSL